MLLNNEDLPWSLRQRFQRNSPYRNLKDLKAALTKYGNDSCVSNMCDYDADTMTLDCSYRDLKTTKSLDDVCEEVRRIRLNGNLLRDSEEIGSLMEKFSDTRSLELQDNRFEGFLTRDMLKRAKYLQSIDLSQNEIGSLPEEFFASNSLLQNIQMRRNLLQNLPEGLLERNPQLTTFDVRDNHLQNLPPRIFKMNGLLEAVLLDYNRLVEMKNETFSNNPKLRTVQLKSNGLNGSLVLEFTEDLGNIEELKLSNNRITDVVVKGRDRTREADHVRLIELNENNLQVMPIELLKKTPNARIILLARNRISNVSEDSLKLVRFLQELDLSDNRLTHISSNIFEDNSQLEDIKLDLNSLRTLPRDLLASNSKLRSFSASSNQLTSIPADLFVNNPYLREVKLADNQIGTIGLPDTLFKNKLKLEYVALGGNRLESISVKLFQDAPRLRQVYLQLNRLRHLPAGTFDAKNDENPTSKRDRSGVPDGSLNDSVTDPDQVYRSRLRIIDLSGNEGLSESLARRFDDDEVSDAMEDIKKMG